MRKIKYLVLLQILFLIISCTPQGSEKNKTVVIKDAWVREVPGGSDITAGYMVLENLTDVDDRLLEVSCDFADKTEIHRSYIDESNLARMEQVNSIEIRSREMLEFSPGGYHLMFMGVEQDLNSKNKLKLELNFEKNGKKIIEAEVKGF